MTHSIAPKTGLGEGYRQVNLEANKAIALRLAEVFNGLDKPADFEIGIFALRPDLRLSGESRCASHGDERCARLTGCFFGHLGKTFFAADKRR